MAFTGKTTVITGGAKGFGRALASALVTEGGNVILADIDESELIASAEELNRTSNKSAKFMVCDVTDKSQVDAMMKKAIDECGSIDILINSAGGSMWVPKVPIEEVAESDWDRVIDVNLKGTFLCVQAAIRYMKKACNGKIVNFASIAARIGGQMTPVQYSSSKGAIVTFTRHVAQELGPFGINVNAVAPALVLTGDRTKKMWYSRNDSEGRKRFIERIPLGRLAEVDEVIKTVMFLCSDDASYITGLTVDVNGGMFSP